MHGSWWHRQIGTVTQGTAKPQCLATQMASCTDEQELKELLLCMSWQCSTDSSSSTPPAASLCCLWCTCALVWCHSPVISIPVPFPLLFYPFLSYQLLVGSSWSHCSLACASNLVSFLHTMFLSLMGGCMLNRQLWEQTRQGFRYMGLCIGLAHPLG